MMNQKFIDGSTLLGVALSLFGIGAIIPMLWQKLVMYICCFIYLIFAVIAFFAEKKD